MDQSNRRQIINSKRNNSQNKNVQEMNGNIPSAAMYKAENVRRHRQKREFYKHEAHNPGRLEDGVGSYLPLHGQRLFAAVSDPAVCGYPISLGYPYDPIHVPLGYPIYPQHPPYPHRVPCKDTHHSPRRMKLRQNNDKITRSKDTFQTVDEYTSLPPGNFQDNESDHQRRFSDPGLANNTESEGDSLSDDGSSASWYDDSQVSGQVEILLQENKRLSRELKETQAELQELKSEVALLMQMQTSFEPGFVTELVHEVHEATKLREETLMAKIRIYTENLHLSKPPSSQPPGETLDREELAQRLANLESQMKAILAHNSGEEQSKQELSVTKQEKLLLQQELKSAEEARDTAEASVLKYERLFNSLSKRLPNGLVLEDKGAQPAIASLDTSESLSSSLGSGSLHSPQVTMSGPVTDL